MSYASNIRGAHRRAYLGWLLLLPALGCQPRPLGSVQPAPPPIRAAVAGGPDAAAPEARRVRLTILFTNDLHGQLEPLVRFTDEAQPRAYRLGGAEALAATIAELRADNPQGTLLVDAGDFMQGGLLTNHYEGAPVRDFFALLRYDAVIVGNHEFDYGPVGVPDPPLGQDVDRRGALRAFCAAAPFPVLSANLARADGQALEWKGLRRSVLIERGGIKVGLVGLTTPQTAVTTMPAFVAGLRFEAWRPVLRREAAALRAAGAHAVVVLAHGGGECPETQAESCRGELFSELLDGLEPGLVDAVVAGHSHQPIAHQYRGVPVSEACSRGQAVGRLELFFDSRDRRYLGGRSRALAPLPVCAQIFAGTGDCVERPGQLGAIRDNPVLQKHHRLVETVRRRLRPYRQGVADFAERILASAVRPLRHHRAEVSETGTLFAQALLAAVPGADIAVFNSGAVRGDLPSGTIRFSDLYTAFPFDNRLATARLTGAELTRMVAHLVDRSYGLPLVAGMRLRMRCGPPRELVSLLDSRGRQLLPRRLYTAVLSDFLLSGGDGLGPVLDPLPPTRKRIYPTRLIRDVIAAYLERQGKPLNSAADPVVSNEQPARLYADGPCPLRPKPTQVFCR